MTKKYILTESQLNEMYQSTWQDGFAILRSLKPVDPLSDEKIFTLWEMLKATTNLTMQDPLWVNKFELEVSRAIERHYFGELK